MSGPPRKNKSIMGCSVYSLIGSGSRRGAYRCILAVLLLVSAAMKPPAQEPERITVEAEYLPSDPRSISSQVTVITEEEIRAAAPDNVAELVASVTGVQINRYGGATEPSMVSIRGSSPEQVLVLINGKRLNSAQGGGVDLAGISTDDIERIEVVRGGGSARYGEGAFGGVINVITKEGYGKEMEFSVKYGFSSYFTNELSWQLLGPLGSDAAGDFFLGLHGMSTAGGYSYTDQRGDDPAVRENTAGLRGDASFKLGWTLSDLKGIRLALSGQLHGSKKGVPGLAEFPTPEAEMEDLLGLGRLSFAYRNNPFASIALDLHAVRRRRLFSDPGFFLGPVEDRHENTAFGTDIELSRKDDFRWLFLKTAAGYSFRFDRLVSSSLFTSAGAEASGTAERTAHGVFFSEELHILPFTDSGYGRIQITPAFRYDAHEIRYTDDAFLSSRGRMSYSVGALVPFGRSRRLVVKGNAGTSYRSPSFDDLFWPATAFAVGNPSLEPEEAVVLDAGLLIKPFQFLSLEAVYYYHDVTNLIQWNPGPSGRWTPGNVGKALMTGVEAEMKMLFYLEAVRSYLEFRGNYTYLAAVDAREGSTTEGKQLPRRARHRGNFSLTWKHEAGHSLYLGGNYVGKRYQTAANTKFLPSYFVLNATGRFRIGEYLTVILTVKNLLNLEYIDIREFPIPGREIGCSIELNV